MATTTEQATETEQDTGLPAGFEEAIEAKFAPDPHDADETSSQPEDTVADEVPASGGDAADANSGGAETQEQTARDPRFEMLQRLYQLSDEDVNGFSSPEELHRALTFAERRMAGARPAFQPPVPPMQPWVPPEGEQKLVQQPDGTFKLEWELDEKEYDPSIVANMKRLEAEIQRLQSLPQMVANLPLMEQVVADQLQAQQVQRIAELDDKIEDGFKALDDSELFGTGTRHELKDPTAFATRKQFVNMVLANPLVDPNTGIPYPMQDQMLRHYRAMFHDRILTKTNRDVVAKAKAQSKQRLGSGKGVAREEGRYNHPEIGNYDSIVEKFNTYVAANEER